MIRDALDVPRAGDGAVRRLLIGGALTLGALIITLPQVLVFGYLLQTIRLAAGGEDEPPDFTGWKAITIDGLRATAVLLLFHVPLLVLLGVILGGAVGIDLYVMTDTAVPTVPVVGVLGLVGGVGELAVLYVLPGALASLAIGGTIGDAFDFDRLRVIVRTREYARGVGSAIVLLLLGGVIGGALSILLIGVIILFYVQVAAAVIVGRSFRDAAEAVAG